MDRTQQLQLRSAEGTPHNGTEQQPLLAVIVAAALIIAIATYMVLRGGPNVIAMVAPWLASLPAETSANGWIAPSVAVGTLLAGGSLAAIALAAFVRGVRQDPFRWLAPVLIAFSSVVMTRLGVERSMGPMAAALFGALTALLLLGGGVLVQAKGLLVACSGGVLLALPVLGLVLEQAHYARGLDKLLLVRDSDALLAMLVLSMTSVGVGLTAFVGRPTGSLARAAERGRDWDRHRDQLGQALERARISELRLGAAEERAQQLEQMINEHCEGYETEDVEIGAAMRPKSLQRAFIAFGVFVIGVSAGAVALHAMMVSPLQAQLATERNVASAALAKRESHVGDVESARVQLEADRTRLSAELAAEKQRAEAALLETKTAKEQIAALGTEAAAAKDAAVKAEKAPAKVAKKAHVSRRAKRTVAARASKPAANPALREAVSDDPIAGLE